MLSMSSTLHGGYSLHVRLTSCLAQIFGRSTFLASHVFPASDTNPTATSSFPGCSKQQRNASIFLHNKIGRPAESETWGCGTWLDEDTPTFGIPNKDADATLLQSPAGGSTDLEVSRQCLQWSCNEGSQSSVEIEILGRPSFISEDSVDLKQRGSGWRGWPQKMAWWRSEIRMKKQLDVSWCQWTVGSHLGVSENVVPHCTQWFCWSLSLWKMAISLGILTQHFQLPTHISLNHSEFRQKSPKIFCRKFQWRLKSMTKHIYEKMWFRQESAGQGKGEWAAGFFFFWMENGFRPWLNQNGSQLLLKLDHKSWILRQELWDFNALTLY